MATWKKQPGQTIGQAQQQAHQSPANNYRPGQAQPKPDPYSTASPYSAGQVGNYQQAGEAQGFDPYASQRGGSQAGMYNKPEGVPDFLQRSNTAYWAPYTAKLWDPRLYELNKNNSASQYYNPGGRLSAAEIRQRFEQSERGRELYARSGGYVR